MYIHYNSIKLKRNELILFFLLIPFFEPLLFKTTHYSSIDKIYSILKIIVLFIIVLQYLKERILTKCVSRYTEIIVGMEMIIIFSTIVNNGDIVKCMGPMTSTIALVLITELYTAKCKINFVRIVRNLLGLLFFINFILQLKYPTGILDGTNFLGIDNRLIFFYLPLLFCSLIYDVYLKNKISMISLVIFFISMWSLLSLWAVGGFIGLFLMIIPMIFGKMLSEHFKLDMNKMIIVIILLNVMIVFFQFQNYFEDFITVYLKKDVTLLGRSILWNYAKKSILEYPILGFGIQNNTFLRKLYRWVLHPHNLFLNYLTTSGIVGFVFYIWSLFYMGNNSNLIKNKMIRYISIFTVFSILILSIADTLDSSIFFMIFSFTNLYHKEIELEDCKII